MWDTIKPSIIGVGLLRRLFIALIAGIISVLFAVSALTSSAFAAPLGDSVTVDGQNYTKKALTLPGTDANSTIYVPNTEDTTCPRPEKVVIVQGEAAEDGSAPAKQATYTVDCDGNYSSPKDQKDVTVSTAVSTDENGQGAAKEQTSCAVKGIGWIVCSVSRFMADSMDRIYGWVSDYLTVQPLSTDSESPLFRAWTIVRGIANALFVAAFLLIIYSHLTNQGISNYDIKKMVPRLIIASLLVNVSYYICAIGVDISNILGDSIAASLTEIRNSLPSPTPMGGIVGSTSTWGTVATFILSGGTIGTIGAIGFTGAAVGGSVAALAMLLFPTLIAAVLSALVALLILAARQALITVLVVLSPLAFVAFLLPNTEKQFDRWKDLFIKMLMIFPMFSLLFGGSQLASFIILQNTDKLSVVILALLVQAAPLALTPFLVQFSGSLLGKLAGMVNDPKKGLVDRTRNWSKERAETHAKRAQASGAMRPAYTPSGLSYRRSRSKRSFENRKKLYETKLDAALANDVKLHGVQAETKVYEMRKSTGDSLVEQRFETLKQTRGTDASVISGVNRLEQSRLSHMQAAGNARWEEAVANPEGLAHTNPYTQFAQAANEAYKSQRVADSNITMAKSVQSSDFASLISDDANVALQVEAGGIGKHGTIKVKAGAMSEIIQEGLKNVTAIETAAPVKAGDIKGMKLEFDKAVANNDVDSMRAYLKMMSESSDPGFKAIREVINKHHETIKASDMHETFMHSINSNSAIAASAKDIADYSRDGEAGYRKLELVTNDYGTWKNLSSSQFSTQKASSQIAALMSKDSSGNWAITQEQAAKIAESNSFDNVKKEVQAFVLARSNSKLTRRRNVADGVEVFIPRIEDDIPPLPEEGFSPRRS